MLDKGTKEIRIVIRDDALEDGGDTFEAHARINRWLGEWS